MNILLSIGFDKKFFSGGKGIAKTVIYANKILGNPQPLNSLSTLFLSPRMGKKMGEAVGDLSIVKLGDGDATLLDRVGEHRERFFVQYNLHGTERPGFKALGGFGGSGHTLVDSRWNFTVD
jgi:hypothetical protein